MNKTDLIEKVAAAAGISKAKAKIAVEATFDGIKGAMVKGDKVQLIGFGTFGKRKVPARDAKNPQTGKVVKVPAHGAPVFKAGKALKDAVK